MMEWRLYLEEVREKIKAETIEQVQEWCKSRNLETYNEGFNEYVLIYEFELAYDFEYIVKLIEEYGSDWFKYYTNREYKTHIPPSKIEEITLTYPDIKSGLPKVGIQSSVLSNLDNKTFTVKEAAAKILSCEKTIRNAIKAGHLKAEISNRGTKNKRYIISSRELDIYLQENKSLASKSKFKNDYSIKNLRRAS